jgi:hypothetical protein
MEENQPDGPQLRSARAMEENQLARRNDMLADCPAQIGCPEETDL